MGNRFFAVLGVAATLALAACSSSETEKPAATGNTASTAATASNVNAPVAATAPNSISNTNAIVTGSVVTPVDANSMASTDVPGEPMTPPQLQGRYDKFRQGAGTSGPPVDAVALAMKYARPAPDNSTFTSYLSDAGYEIRTFKNHPQLQKVEKRTSNEGTSTIKVFLRNGKVVEVPAQSIPALANAPAAQIMAAAGLSAPAAKPPTGATGAKTN